MAIGRDLEWVRVGVAVPSDLATGASCLCYFRVFAVGHASRMAMIDKLSVVMMAAVVDETG